MFYRFLAKENLNPLERKNYITSLIGEYGRLGTIDKFNNAIGFKPVSFDIVTRTFPSDDMCPKGYQTPAIAIISAIRMIIDNNTIVGFDVPDIDVVHPIAKYSFNTLEIFKRFVNFAKKVYPEIEIVETNNVEETLLSRVLNHLYLCLAESDCIDAEISSSRLLTEDEIAYLMKTLQPLTTREFEIAQFYCETCARYDESHPYHIEIEYS